MEIIVQCNVRYCNNIVLSIGSINSCNENLFRAEILKFELIVAKKFIT